MTSNHSKRSLPRPWLPPPFPVAGRSQPTASLGRGALRGNRATRQLHKSAPPPLIVLAVVLLSALQVMLIYGLSASLMQGYSSQWEWFSLGALLLTVVVSLSHLLPAS
jgi:hypothetical protein